MRKVLMISVMLFLATILYARYSTAIYSDKAFATSSAFADSSSQFSLDYETYVSYALYTEADSLQAIVSTQGRIGGNWVTLHKDTLTKTATDDVLMTELRNSTTDHLKGVNIVRLYINFTPDDDDTTGTYSMQVTAR